MPRTIPLVAHIRRNQMKAKVVIIEGYWKDTRESFEKRCVVMPSGATDSMRDEVLDEARSGLGFNGIFYEFESGDPIVGEHLDFVVVFYHPVSEIELGELQ
jgi:hypothetical protein